MNWQDNLGGCLINNGHNRLRYLNRELAKGCKEWTSYANEYAGISAVLEYNKSSDYEDFKIECLFIKVTEEQTFRAPFKAYIGFFSDEHGRLCLFMKTTKSFTRDPIILIQGGEHFDDKKYDWHKEMVISENEMTEEGFVLQSLNNRYNDFLQTSPK